MKKQVFIFLLMLIVSGMQTAVAQNITFCKAADSDGQAVSTAKEFTLTKTGAAIVLLFQFGNAKPASISYDLYKAEKGNEVFQSTLKQVVTPSKNWVSKSITLYDAGLYRVYVYDEKDKLLTKSEFTVKPAGN